MIAFSYRSFREHLNSDLAKAEAKFLMRTFGYSALYFFSFGIIVILFNTLLKSLNLGGSWVAYGLCVLIGCVLLLPLQFFYVKYQNNPLRVPSSFVTACFLLLTISFLTLFIGVVGILSNIIGDDQYFIPGIVLSVFGISCAIYLIPVAVVWIINNKKKTLKLKSLIDVCYLIFAALFIVFILIGVFGFGLTSASQVIFLIIVSGLAICCPVLTLYRFKTVAYYINYDDEYERRRWENFFAFSIAFQLLKIAFFVLKITVSLLMRSSSRLR